MKTDIIASSPRMTIRRTTDTDFDFVLRLENDPENARFLIPWTDEQHQATITDPHCAHWILEKAADETPIGYVILATLDHPDGSIEFKRVVIADQGKGYGREALQVVKRLAFERYRAHRLYLDVFDSNERAIGLYRSEGFTVEGKLRECVKRGKEFASLVVMSILQREYEAAQMGTARKRRKPAN